MDEAELNRWLDEQTKRRELRSWREEEARLASADIDVTLEDRGRGSYRARLFNSGGSSATSVELTCADAGGDSVMPTGKVATFDQLAPGHHVDVIIGYSKGARTPYTARAAWKNPDGSTGNVTRQLPVGV